VANRIINGDNDDNDDLGPIDQANYNKLAKYAEEHAKDIDWMNTRERQFTVAALQLQRAQAQGL